MTFDPTDVEAIKKLARDNCKEMIDIDLHGIGNKSNVLGVEKYLSDEYLGNLDVETRAKFLAVYDAESKLYYQELSETAPPLFAKEFAEIHANLDKVEAGIKRMNQLNAFMKKFIIFIPFIAAIMTIIHYL